jgi:hypothetical protein
VSEAEVVGGTVDGCVQLTPGRCCLMQGGYCSTTVGICGMQSGLFRAKEAEDQNIHNNSAI